MNYLITHPDFEPFYTNWFDVHNNYIHGMTVFNLLNVTHTTDGIHWVDTKIDSL